MSRVYALYQLPHPIPRAGFSLNRRQPEPSDRSRHPLAHPRSRQRHPPRQTLTPSPSFSLSIPLPPRISPSPVSLPPSLFSLCSLHLYLPSRGVRRRVCGERFLRARAFNDSRFRFRSETILWQRSTALQRTENGENGRLFASRGFPPISLSRRPSLSLSLSVFSPGKKENLIARPFNGPRHDKMRLCSLFLHVMYYFFSFFLFLRFCLSF